MSRLIDVQQALAHTIPFVCPRCKGGLEEGSSSYRCAACGKIYPILFGIADFRLRSDRYLSLNMERAKARRLHKYAQCASFEELVAYYYSITDDVPGELALRYRAYIRGAPQRARYILRDLASRPESDALIDLGCGTGGLLIAASERFREMVGVDIALRWLVICQKRLMEEGVSARLVCADVEALPFPESSFTHAVAADLVEHVYDVDHALLEVYNHLKPDGLLWLSAANRYCLGPHASTRVWGVGCLPKRLRARLFERLKGIDLLRYVNLVSPGSLARSCQRHGFSIKAQRPRQIAAGPIGGYPWFDRVLISLYRGALRFALLRGVLLKLGPAFEMICRKARLQASDRRPAR